MNKLNLFFKGTEKFNILVSDIPGGVKLTFTGSVDDRNPELSMSNFFDELHYKLTKSNLKYVEVDFTNMIYLNSSGLKIFVSWLTKNATLPTDQRYRLQIFINAIYHWQENSTAMMKMMVPDLVSIHKMDQREIS